MWELDHKESWVPKNWCFWTVVLEKTLESPLDCKEFQPANPKRSQSWIFIGRTDAEAEVLILWPPDPTSQFTGKDPDAGGDWKQEERRAKKITCLDGNTDSMDLSLSKPQEIVKDREVCHAAVHGVARLGCNWATEQQQHNVPEAFNQPCKEKWLENILASSSFSWNTSDVCSKLSHWESKPQVPSMETALITHLLLTSSPSLPFFPTLE